MFLTFQMMLKEAGLALQQVRLLRHAPKAGYRSSTSPHRVWLDDRPRFEDYQSTQLASDRRYFDVSHWASFVGLPDRRTMFVGLYVVELSEREIAAYECPLTHAEHPAGRADRYLTTVVPDFEPYEAKLFIDWGAGTRSWGQRAERREKPITELLKDQNDPPYPGHSSLLLQLSEIESLPASWRAVLNNARGVYLLTCPRTREQYVGGAYSGTGFLSRWEQHARHQGDAIAFRSRDPADYRVSVLEVAGSLVSDDEIATLETRWKEKLQSREMGLNRN